MMSPNTLWTYLLVARVLVVLAVPFWGSTHAEEPATEPAVVLTTADTVPSSVATVSGLGDEARLDVQAAFSFTRDIAPILQQRCLECHREERARGRYRVDTFEALFRAGASDSDPLVNGRKDQGEVLRLLRSADPDERMPQDADPLSEEELQKIEGWVAAGAEFDRPDGDREKAWVAWLRPEYPPSPRVYPKGLPTTALAFSPDGTRLVSGGYHELLLWDVDSGRLIQRLGGMPERTLSIQWHEHESERLIAVAGGSPGRSGESLLVILPETLEEGMAAPEVRSLHIDRDVITAIAISPDGQRALSGGTEGVLWMHQVSDGTQLLRLPHHADWVLSVTWSATGDRFATASRDRTARVCEASTGDGMASYTEHGAPVEAVVFSPDAETVWSGGRDRRVRRWRTEDSSRREIWDGFDGEVIRVVESGGRLFASTRSGQVRGRGSADGKKAHIYSEAGQPVHSMAAHAGRELLAVGDAAGGIRVWDWSGGKPKIHFPGAPLEISTARRPKGAAPSQPMASP